VQEKLSQAGKWTGGSILVADGIALQLTAEFARRWRSYRNRHRDEEAVHVLSTSLDLRASRIQSPTIVGCEARRGSNAVAEYWGAGSKRGPMQDSAILCRTVTTV
jgi:hypothetical protein